MAWKALDRAFQGVGHRTGIDVWRIENSKAVATTQSGCFNSKHSYVVLHTQTTKNGVFQYHIHYWLGKRTPQKEATAAAVKAVELCMSLGAQGLQYKEVQGFETDRFLSYFYPCFVAFEENDLPLTVRGPHDARLFMCKGRHVVRVKEVLFARSSLTHDSVFILVTLSKIFQFNGSNTDDYERAKALDVVQYLNMNILREKRPIAIVEDGRLVSDDNGDFWGLFGGYAPLFRRMDDDQGSFETETSEPMLFCIHETQAKEVGRKSLQKQKLCSNKCYVLQSGDEWFTWAGLDASLEERKQAVLIAEEMIANCKHPHRAHLTCTIENLEPPEFRSKFEAWPAPTTEQARVGAVLRHKGLNVQGLTKESQAKKQNLLLNNDGKLQVWCVHGLMKDSIPPREHGKFYSNNAYVILYSYLEDKSNNHLVFSWFGRQVTMDTRKTTLQHTNVMASSLQGKKIEVHIFEGKEPNLFLSLFEYLFIMKGDESTESTRLFQVQQSGPSNWQAIQVPLVPTSLNSSGCFVLQRSNSFFTWYGKFSTLGNQQATQNMIQHMKPGMPSTTLKEGSESQMFWDALGGNKFYPSHAEPKETAKDPQLFCCTMAKGQVKVKEVFNFTQEDLLSDEILILDCHSDVFVWVGKDVTATNKLKAFEYGQQYLEQSTKYADHSMETPIYKILEGSEPPFFTSHFSWNSSRTMCHLNPFQRKFQALEKLPEDAKDEDRPRSWSHMSEEKCQPVLERVQLSLSSNGAFKPPQPLERIRTPRKKPGHGHLSGKSAALSALSKQFELQNGGGAPPNTPIVKFSAHPLKNKETKREGPPCETPLSSRTPRSAVSPAIATLTSVFESYSDRFAFAWPGTKSRYAEMRRDCDLDSPSSFPEISEAEENESPEKPDQPAGRDNAASSCSIDTEDVKKDHVRADTMRQDEDSERRTYPYERLKVSSADPVLHIDSTKRETYLIDEEFQDVFRMDRVTFYKLPKWKQDRYKLLHDLF